MKHFTLHARLTKRCNADCSYCSSWQDQPIPYMDAASFAQAVDFIIDRLMPLYGFTPGSADAATIQYVGGEVLTIPPEVLRANVIYARRRFGRLFSTVRDGVQSNLIGSEARVLGLNVLFGPRIGTSVETVTSLRTVGGSAERYRDMAAASREVLRRRRRVNPGGIFVVDADGAGNLPVEMARAEAEGYALVLRPVFRGGKATRSASVEAIITAYGRAMDAWLMTMRVPVEPFHQLLLSRLAEASGDASLAVINAACPFRADCATVSLDLEPNGDLYVCLDMADSAQFKLGNALTGEFSEDTRQRLLARRDHLVSACRVCPWRGACQGGCMSESIHQTGDPFGRTELCDLWRSLFTRIDTCIEHHGLAAVKAWAFSLRDQVTMD
jgi:radical SAM protein with 4Fe4S-binding SPASM domain